MTDKQITFAIKICSFIAIVLMVLFVVCTFAPTARAQIQISGTNLTVTPVNNGTGTLVSIPIPGGSGLSITVGQGTAALPLENISGMSGAVNPQMGDDGWTDIPLPFQFPYWGQTFTDSTMYSNGAVQFGRPVNGSWPANNTFCCNGENLTTLTNTAYNYSIMPLWTDLYDHSGRSTWYRLTATSATYGWYNTSECCNSLGGNSFSLTINSSGTFNVAYGGINISYHNVTIGMTGNIANGEYVQIYNGYAPYDPTNWSWSALSGTGANLCVSNPLSSPTCPGYQEAYFTQQCSVNPLYSPSCPGYALAFFTQQCTLDPLYSVDCPGYAQAYFNQQCSLNGLYDRTCPNYAEAYARANILPSTSTSTSSTSSSTTTASTTVSSDGTVSTTVSTTGSTTVDRAITTTTTTTNSAAAPAAPVQLVQPAQAVSNENTTRSPNTPAQTQSATAAVPANQQQAQGGGTDKATTTPRQQLAEKREEQKQASNRQAGKEAAQKMDKAPDMQAQVAAQGSVIAAMSFVPGFNAYSIVLPDAMGYKSQGVYNNQRTVDNARAMRGLSGASDRLHEQMVGSQYK